jgi:hypothetical protein
VLHPMLSTPLPPKGYSTLEYQQGYPWGNTWATTRVGQCDSGSAIWSHTPPTRSDLRTSQHRRQRGPQTRIFSPQLILVCRRPRCRKREKWQGSRPPILTIHRTETTRRSDFAVNLIRRDRRAPVMMLVHEECRITCDHRHSLWYLTGSLDCGLSRNAIRQCRFVPMAAASRIEASASLSGEFRTLHSTTCCHTAECSPSMALAQCALGCKPQMCGRLLQKGATKTKRAYRTTHAHHRGEIRPESRPKAQPGMAGAIAGRLGRVCLAYSARYPRLPVEECGGRGAAFGDLAQIEASSCGSRSDRNLRGLTRRVDCTHFRPWPTMGT